MASVTVTVTVSVTVAVAAVVTVTKAFHGPNAIPMTFHARKNISI